MNMYELEPTDENIIESFLSDTIKRNEAVFNFIKILDSFNNSYSISIDGQWGSGKTFFIKQVILTLRILNESLDNNSIDKTSIEKLNKHIMSKGLKIRQYLPVYYDAWMNDSSEDPLASIIYELVNNDDINGHIENIKDTHKIACEILEFFTGVRISNMIDELKGDYPLQSAKKEKSIHEKIDKFIKSITKNTSNRLIIFIDELDRCKPSYSIQLLERIKHYFSNNDILFVFSANLEQLQHTVKKYYGNDFDAFHYLDRFFNFQIQLPPADKQAYSLSCGLNLNHTYDVMRKLVIDQYGFELRDIARYMQYTELVRPVVHNKTFKFPEELTNDFCLRCILPIMIGIKIKNELLYKQFIGGLNKSPLMDILGRDEKLCYSLCYEILVKTDNVPTYNHEMLLQALNDVYDSIFIHKYSTKLENIQIGSLCFTKDNFKTIMDSMSLLSSKNTEGIE